MAGEGHERDLGALIDLEITLRGPMSLASYMALCLTHPARGYYRKADPLGAEGDFITAPEISQMFGELIGFFLVNLWQQMGEPRPFTLMELGPGRGTLMADVLRVATRAPGFREALALALFETGPALMAQQKERLGAFSPQWVEDFDDGGEGPLLVIANEFFDALPIRQFVRAKTGWHERVVGLIDGKRAFGLSPTPLPESAMPEAVRAAGDGEMVEISLAAAEVMTRLGELVGRRGGAILAVDYGYARTRTGETLQAVRRHAFADPLEAPGEADLSAHVDFGALAGIARRAGLAVQPLASQGDFLARLGIRERARALAAANPAAGPEIAEALDRLTAPERMGALFKVFCASSPGLVPEGFAP